MVRHLALDQTGGWHVHPSEGVTVAGLDSARAQDGHSCHRIWRRRIRATAAHGFASRRSSPASNVHTHNLGHGRFRPTTLSARRHPHHSVAYAGHLPGIVRADGRVATRNYIGILTSVNCSATVHGHCPTHFRRDRPPGVAADFPTVDGLVALTHGQASAPWTPKVRPWPFCNAR